MKEIIEKEIKYIISKSDYEKLYNHFLNKFKLVERLVQTNHYLECNNGYLRKNKISARIREIDNTVFEYTVKQKLKKENNVSIKKETTILLSNEEFMKIKLEGVKKDNDFLLKPVRENSDLVINDDISIIGHLTTERINFEIEGFITPITLDKSHYLSKEDYELEWETDQIIQAKEVIEGLFEILGVIPLKEYGSKNERFQMEFLKGGEVHEKIRFSSN